jgi:hypothetical protein
VALLEPAGRLREGNALLNIGFATMYTGGPALAALLVAAVGPAPVLALAGGVFFVLAFVVGSRRTCPPARPTAARRSRRCARGSPTSAATARCGRCSAARRW